jgi:hypothetical protein
MQRGLIVPVAIERDIPGEIAEELDIVVCVHVGVDTSGWVIDGKALAEAVTLVFLNLNN